MSTMSMTIASQVSSDRVFITATAEPRPKQSAPRKRAQQALASGLDVVRGVLAVASDEEQRRECCSGGANGIADYGSEERIVSRKEILQHGREGDTWIVVDGKVYDVTHFLDVHPGGAELILDFVLSGDAEKDAGPLMRGLDEDGHSHSKAAFNMLQQFLVGSLDNIASGSGSQVLNPGKKKYRYDVDFKKPIVCQVGHLGADYDEWVHDPVVTKDTPRFFESDVAEGQRLPLDLLKVTGRQVSYPHVSMGNSHMMFTKTKWWVVPLVWVPVALAMIGTAILKEGVPLSRMPALLAGGILLWSSLEYLLHRFLFHMKTTSFWGNTIHYVLHGFHHKHPLDGARLVFPPMFAAPICMLIWIGLGNWAAAYPNKLVIYAIGLICYVMYDVIHYFLHFGPAFNDHSRQMKRYHLNHHFKDQTMGFGITSTVWDIVFGTKPSMD